MIFIQNQILLEGMRCKCQNHQRDTYDQSLVQKDIVVLNAAVGLLVDNKVNSTEEGIEMARDVIQSGKL